DDGVAAVLVFGGHERERAVGERGVVAPNREQLTLAVDHDGVEVGDAAHDQPGGHLVAGVFERGVAGFGDLRAGDPPLLLVVPDRLRVGDLDPGVLGNRLDRPAYLGVD